MSSLSSFRESIDAESEGPHSHSRRQAQHQHPGPGMNPGFDQSPSGLPGEVPPPHSRHPSLASSGPPSSDPWAQSLHSQRQDFHARLRSALQSLDERGQPQSQRLRSNHSFALDMGCAGVAQPAVGIHDERALREQSAARSKLLHDQDRACAKLAQMRHSFGVNQSHDLANLHQGTSEEPSPLPHLHHSPMSYGSHRPIAPAPRANLTPSSTLASPHRTALSLAGGIAARRHMPIDSQLLGTHAGALALQEYLEAMGDGGTGDRLSQSFQQVPMHYTVSRSMSAPICGGPQQRSAAAAGERRAGGPSGGHAGAVCGRPGDRTTLPRTSSVGLDSLFCLDEDDSVHSTGSSSRGQQPTNSCFPLSENQTHLPDAGFHPAPLQPLSAGDWRHSSSQRAPSQVASFLMDAIARADTVRVHHPPNSALFQHTPRGPPPEMSLCCARSAPAAENSARWMHPHHPMLGVTARSTQRSNEPTPPKEERTPGYCPSSGSPAMWRSPSHSGSKSRLHENSPALFKHTPPRHDGSAELQHGNWLRPHHSGIGSSQPGSGELEAYDWSLSQSPLSCGNGGSSGSFLRAHVPVTRRASLDLPASRFYSQRAEPLESLGAGVPSHPHGTTAGTWASKRNHTAPPNESHDVALQDLERSCRRLDEASIRISQIDLSHIAAGDGGGPEGALYCMELEDCDADSTRTSSIASTLSPLSAGSSRSPVKALGAHVVPRSCGPTGTGSVCRPSRWN